MSNSTFQSGTFPRTMSTLLAKGFHVLFLKIGRPGLQVAHLWADGDDLLLQALQLLLGDLLNSLQVRAGCSNYVLLWCPFSTEHSVQKDEKAKCRLHRILPNVLEIFKSLPTLKWFCSKKKYDLGRKQWKTTTDNVTSFVILTFMSSQRIQFTFPHPSYPSPQQLLMRTNRPYTQQLAHFLGAHESYNAN
jgi:hypothetical protein